MVEGASLLVLVEQAFCNAQENGYFLEVDSYEKLEEMSDEIAWDMCEYDSQREDTDPLTIKEALLTYGKTAF